MREMTLISKIKIAKLGMAWIDSDANSGNKCSAMKPYSYLFHTLLCAMQLFKFQTTLTYLDNIALFQSYISQVSS